MNKVMSAMSNASRSLRDSMVWLMPVLIVSSLSIFVINLLLFLGLGNGQLEKSLLVIHESFFKLIPYMFAVATGSILALRFQLSRPPIALLCLAGVFLIEIWFESSGGPPFQGIEFFIGLSFAFMLTPVCAFLYRRNWFSLIRVNVTGDNIKDSINLIVPGGIALIFSLLLVLFASELLGRISLPSIPLDPHNHPYQASAVIALLNSLFWFLGIHGYYAIIPLLEQIDAQATLNGVINSEFLGSFVFIGGGGATLSLITAIFIFSKDRFHKKIALISLPFALFGINEVILFCLPVIFNLRVFIPFVLVPFSNALIATTAFQLGWIELSSSFSLINSPILFNAWLAAGGNLNGPLLQVTCLIAGVCLYAPFIQLLDRSRLIKKVRIKQLKATFTGILEEFSAKIDDPLQFIVHRNEKIRHLQKQFVEISDYTFLLHYQPKVDPKSGRVVGAEALIRAKDTEGYLVPPGRFLPAFHEADIIHYIDVWVAEEATEQLEKWRSDGQALVPVSINVSTKTLNRKEAFNRIMGVIAPYSEYVRIEITEESLADFNDMLNSAISSVKAAGIALDIDDFGTGYSSLSYLNKADFDSVKIDRSFVTDLNDPRKQKLLNAILQFSHGMGFSVIVEGVETQAQVDILKNHSNLSIQGWFYSKALPAEDFQAFIYAAQTQAAEYREDGPTT